MKEDLLKIIIRDFHLATLPSLKERLLIIPLDSQKIITIIGVRRCGKSAYLYKTIEKLIQQGVDKTHILYLNFEDERLILKIEDMELIIKAYLSLYPNIELEKCYFFFDEIQNIDGWDKFIRRLYDTVTKNIFITGSNAKLLSKEIATSLRGRTLSYELFPLSFKEYCAFQQINPDLNSSRSIALIKFHLQNYLQYGGFPELIFFNLDDLKIKTLQEYFNVMMYKDIAERLQIKCATALKFFLKRLISTNTKSFSVAKIYHELKSNGFSIGKDQLYEFLEASLNCYFAFVLPKYHASYSYRELGEKKAYLIDNGLFTAIDSTYSTDYGKLLEQTVFLELKQQPKKQIFFYKDRIECDFVVQEDGQFNLAIQVCYDLTDVKTRQRELNGLVAACLALNIRNALIITNEEISTQVLNGVTINIVPAYRWLLS